MYMLLQGVGVRGALIASSSVVADKLAIRVVCLRSKIENLHYAEAANLAR
jgi:hypothetical protein